MIRIIKIRVKLKVLAVVAYLIYTLSSKLFICFLIEDRNPSKKLLSLISCQSLMLIYQFTFFL